jgi:hypothetical protein
MRIPNRAEVTRQFSESEAFTHAAEIYDDWITKNTPPESAGIVDEVERLVFRPSMELQIAGLSLLAEPDLSEPRHHIVAFACHAVDLQLWGWFAAVNCHPRVAFSLTRSALEACIFGIAATMDYDGFRVIWESRNGTGGNVLKQIKSLSPDTRWLLENAWKLLAAMGHASSGPVLSALTRFRDGQQTRRGLTFAGQFAGPLDARQLEGCAHAFSTTAMAAARFFALSIAPMLSATDEWKRRLSVFENQLNATVPVPDHLAPHVDRYRREMGARPDEDP